MNTAPPISVRSKLFLALSYQLAWLAATSETRAEARRLAADHQTPKRHLHPSNADGEQLLTLGTVYEDGSVHHSYWITADGKSRPAR